MRVLPEERIKAALQQALALINKPQVSLTDVSRAVDILSDLLAAFPLQPDTLQLLGVVRRMQGQNRDSENLYRQSLSVNSKQPHVHHNLGNLLIGENRVDEAIAAQREAIRQKSDYLEAHHNLAAALYRRGDLAAAELSFRAALKINRAYAPSEQGLGAVLNDLAARQKPRRSCVGACGRIGRSPPNRGMATQSWRLSEAAAQI
jgi:Tfp pilus assembly protein PilF